MSDKELIQPSTSGLGKQRKKAETLQQRRLKEREKKRKQREKMKQNSEAHEKFKAKEREAYKKKKERGKVKLISDLTPREQRKQRKQWKIRQQECRQKKKAKHNTTTPSQSPISQVSDSSRTSRGRKKVRRDRSAIFRALKKSETEIQKYKARAERLKKRLYRMNNKNEASPTPKKKVNKMLKNAPRNEIRKRLLFGEALVSELKNKAKTCTLEKEKITLTNMISGKILRKYRLLHETKLFLSQRQLSHMGNIRAQRKSKSTLPKIKILVTKFLQKETSSSFTPGKRDFMTKNKVRMQKRILLDSLKNLHKKFNEESRFKVSYATFCKVKPFWFVHQNINKRDTCLCVKHANYQFIIDKLHNQKLIETKNMEEIIPKVACNKTKKDCMYRCCNRCKDKALPIDSNEKNLDAEVFYYKWMVKTEDRIGKNNKPIQVKITSKEKIACNVSELIHESQIMLDVYLKHVYNYTHQFHEMKALKESLHPNEAIIVMDFSENYICKYSAEIQSVHFGASQQQITLHTSVMYYHKSLQETEDGSCDDIRSLSFCTVSDNLRHDACAVWAHINPILKYIVETFSTIDTIHFQSDSPTAQYRNKTNFFLLAYFSEKFALKAVTWNFTESGHGKSPADGVGGLVKTTADRAVSCGTDIPNYETFFNLLKEADLKVKPYKISTLDIAKIDEIIQNEHPVPIPNTMKLHQVTWSYNSSTDLRLRYLSCFACAATKECRHFSLQPPSFNIRILQSVENFEKDPPTLTSDNDDEQVIEVGTWAAVIYDDCWYPGLIEEINEDKLQINFMNRSGNRFYWPSEADRQEVPKNEILCRIAVPPCPVSSRHFTIQNFQKIDVACTKVLQK
jgi:hypothetical protein